MSDVLERRVVLEVVSHHGVFWGRVRVARRRASHHAALLVVVLVIPVRLAHEVLGAFVLVCAAILCDYVSADDWVAR